MPIQTRKLDSLWNRIDGDGDDADKDAPAADNSTSNDAAAASGADWWDEKRPSLEHTQSFCSNLYVVWDEQGTEDPFIVVSEGPPTLDDLGLPQDDQECDDDARSAVSEPAQMGLFDDSFHTREDMEEQKENKRWLMAWDDLALL